MAWFLGPLYTLLASIWITTYQGGPLDALLPYLTCDGPSRRQYARLRCHKPSMVVFYGTAIMLHEYCAHLRRLSAYLYMFEFVAWSLRSLWNPALFVRFSKRCWKHPLVQAAYHGVCSALELALHYGTLVDDWAWYHRSTFLSRYSYKSHQIWIPYVAVQWQQIKAQHNRPARAYEYRSLKIEK